MFLAVLVVAILLGWWYDHQRMIEKCFDSARYAEQERSARNLLYNQLTKLQRNVRQAQTNGIVVPNLSPDSILLKEPADPAPLPDEIRASVQ
jgi:hypothetical protein